MSRKLGYKTGGRRRPNEKEVCKYNEDKVWMDTIRCSIGEKRLPQKGPRAKLRDLCIENKMTEFSKYVNKCIELGCKKETIFLWVSDLISLNDFNKICMTDSIQKDRKDDGNAR